MIRSIAILFLMLSVAKATDLDFHGDVRPILAERCFSCHGPDKQKGKVRFDTLSTDLANDSAAAETWHDALNALQLGEMPPDDEPQPTDVERQQLTSWIQGALDHALAAKHSTGGKVVIRRLNRAEYQNTMRDLLGLDIDFIRNLPPDTPSPDGFQNNGAALGMTGMQLEQYLDTARDALSRVIVTGPQPEVFETQTQESDQDKGKGNYTHILGRTGQFVSRVEKFPYQGVFEMRVRARAKLPSPDSPFPGIRIDLGYLADTQRPAKQVGTATVSSTEVQEFVFRGRMEEFPLQSKEHAKYPGALIWIRNTYDDDSDFDERKTIETPNPKNPKKPKKTTVYEPDPDFPQVIIESVSFTAPVFQQWPPKTHRRLLPEGMEPEEIITEFLHRAYRRPPTSDEVAELLSFYETIRPNVESLESGMRETLAMALISPQFLYLVEPNQDAESRQLTEYELASRLSYFLWSSMPDDQLFELAGTGKLSQPGTLEAEVERMLSDPKSRRFVEQFSDQWLDLAQLDRVAVNPEYYPDFNDELKPWMRGETHAFFAEILTHNLSALNFIDSDFAMLNQPLARHYGVADGPRGMEFERVPLPADSQRGGLLTMASTLVGNSTGEDSHPIKRAVWIRERLLHDPPAPPPPNVPALDSEDPNFAKLSVREQLELHRKDPSCNDCHRGIDPWGVAMEQFDAIGLFREEIRRKDGKRFVSLPVVANDTLPDGTQVQGIAELKSYLLDRRKDQFTHALTGKLLSYALGRSLELTDTPQVDAIAEDFAASEYRLRDLVKQVATSEAFRTK